MLDRKVTVVITTAVLIIVFTGFEKQHNATMREATEPSLCLLAEDLYMAAPAAPSIPDNRMRSAVASPGIQAGRGKQRISDDELYLLAKIIECEARDEPFDGKLAVGLVVLNRVRSPKFPNTIEGVIFQKGQFQPITDGGWATKEPSPEAFDAARRVLEGVDVNGENGRPVGDAKFFIYEAIADQSSIGWFKSKLQYVTTIGNHDFYTYR
jgi:spore germination cell wall hydrolase CwlJ-like protein